MSGNMKNENPSGSGQAEQDRQKRLKRARKSTGGPAPRKMLGPKGRKYFYEKNDGKIKEVEVQTHPSQSDAQHQVAPETRETSCQTDFNSRFYIERSDRMARGEPSPYANSESDY